MGLTDHIPLMAPGATARNAILAILYVVMFPFVLAALPFYLAYAVGTNRHGLADSLADSPLGAIPTIEHGGWQAALTMFVLAIVLLAAVGAALPGTDQPDAASDTTDDSAAQAGGDADAQTKGDAPPTVTPTPDGGTTTATATATPASIDGGANSSLSDEELLLAFRMTLERNDYTVDSLDIDATNTVILDYRSSASNTEELAGEMGGVAGAFAAGIEEGWGVDGLQVNVHGMDGKPVGEYVIEAAWATKYNTDEYTWEEYFGLIVDSIETYE